MPASTSDPAPANLLLAGLKPGEQSLLVPYLEPVDLRRGDVLFQPGDAVTHVTFPCDGTIATLLVTMQDGRVIETATVGHEGAIGGVVSQGYLPAFNRAVVQVGGPAIRIEAARLQVAKSASPALRNLFTRYSDCLLAQVLQSVACNALHPIEQRCAKALLSLQDRLGSAVLPVTQDVLADMLGVRRTYLSGILRALDGRGLIALSRGRVVVADRPGLADAACECHGRVREHFAEVLGAVYADDGKLVSFKAPAPPKGSKQSAA